MHKEYLFVYGLLRKETPHAMGNFLKLNAEYLGHGYFHGAMYDVGSYPAAIPDSTQNKVFGDIYRLSSINIFEQLDEFEEVGDKFSKPNEYVRDKLEVYMGEKETFLCWVYVYNWPVDLLEKIDSGDYLKYINKDK